MTKHQKKSLMCFVSAVFLLFCVVPATTAQTPQQIAQKAFRSTVLLVMEDAKVNRSHWVADFLLEKVKLRQTSTLWRVPQEAT